MAKKKKEKRNKKVIALIVILIFLLIGVGGRILCDKQLKWNEEKRAEAYNAGAQSGFEQTLGLIFQEAIQCKPFPVSYQNQTINLIAVECLQG